MKVSIALLILVTFLAGCTRGQTNITKKTSTETPLDGAIKRLEQASTQRPDDLGFLIQLAQKYEQRAKLAEPTDSSGWSEKAADSYQRISELAENQQQASGLSVAADFYHRQGEDERAGRLHLMAVERSDGEPGDWRTRSETRRARARFIDDKGDPKLAEQLLTEAIEIMPDKTAHAYLSRARLRQKTGNKEGALSDTQLAIQIAESGDPRSCGLQQVKAGSLALQKELK